MANPAPKTDQLTPFEPGNPIRNNGVYRSPRAQAVALQQLILDRAANKECTDSALASLARSWCLVQEAKRIIDGKPLPGQLRPELDPTQFAKLAKRHRANSHLLYDVHSSVVNEPEDRSLSEPTTEPKTSEPTKNG